MGKRKGGRKVKKSVPYPTSTSLGANLIIAYNIEKQNHQELQQQVRDQEMRELMDASKDGRIYRYGRDSSSRLKKMRNMLKSKGAELRRMREPLHHISRF